MSKRYGRNQKRKAAARIAELERKLKYSEQAGHRNRRIVEETAAVLGRHFITLEPDCVVVQNMDQVARGWRTVFMSDTPNYFYSSGGFDEAAFVERALPVIYCSDVARELQKEVHIRFKYNGRDFAYGISEKALQMMPQMVAERRIANEMASFLVNEINCGSIK